MLCRYRHNIDDATRVIPFAAFAYSDNTTAFLPVFKQAIARRALPARLYVDRWRGNVRNQHSADQKSTEKSLTKLRATHQLRCAGMAKALTEQLGSSEVEALAFEQRLGLLVDRELTERASRQLTNRLRRAKLRHAA